MKKNLLSLVIISLLVVNIALTAIMMFSVTKTNSETAKIVTSIASILDIELNKEAGGSEAGNVALADTEVYSIEEELTISLKRDEGDTKDHYAIVNVSLSMDKKNPDYSKNKDLAAYEDLIKDEIISVIGSYTYTEAQVSKEQIAEEILERIQALYNGSDFIYKVSFSSYMFG